MKALKLASLFAILLLTSCSFRSLRPKTTSAEQRFEHLLHQAPLEKPAVIYWNDYAIPFIQTESDSDLFFTLGMTHAHLRRGQMEILRLLANAQTSRHLGTFGNSIDHAIEILELKISASQQLASMDPKDTKLLNAFVKGINWQISHSLKHEPMELNWLRVTDSKSIHPWTALDVLTIGKLVSFDFAWIGYFQRLKVLGQRSTSPDVEKFLALLHSLGRTGSNSMVFNQKVAQSPMIANDPHLGLFAPNTWLLVGMQSPSYQLTGFMLPGLPFVGVGRNRDLAWGGTNMRALSSYLVRVPARELAECPTTDRLIQTKFWFNKSVQIRRCSIGPVISDHPSLKNLFEQAGIREPIALYWQGHYPSQELGAFFKAMRAKTAQQFYESFKDYAVSAQNYLVVDKAGQLRHVLGYRQPLLKNDQLLINPIQDLDNIRLETISPLQHPKLTDQNSGFIISANNRPFSSEQTLSLNFAPPQRAQRLTTLINQKAGRRLTIEDLKVFQSDVRSESSVLAKKQILQALKDLNYTNSTETFLALQAFDGNYTTDSKTAAIFESFFNELRLSLIGLHFSQSSLAQDLFNDDARFKSQLPSLLAQTSPEALVSATEKALLTASQQLGKTWGQVHTLAFGHPFQNIPLIGASFRIETLPLPGSNETVAKAAHPLSSSIWPVTYGANARHVSDLSDINANYFVMLGGNDGWMRTPQTTNQIELWKTGTYLRIPLDVQEVKRDFNSHVQRIKLVGPAGFEPTTSTTPR